MLDRGALAGINAYNPGLSSAWMLQRAMSVRPGQPPAPGFVNELLGANFAAMSRRGDDAVLKPFLQATSPHTPSHTLTMKSWTCTQIYLSGANADGMLRRGGSVVRPFLKAMSPQPLNLASIQICDVAWCQPSHPCPGVTLLQANRTRSCYACNKPLCIQDAQSHACFIL